MSLFDDEDDVAATVAVLEQNYTALKDVFKSYARSPKGKVRLRPRTPNHQPAGSMVSKK